MGEIRADKIVQRDGWIIESSDQLPVNTVLYTIGAVVGRRPAEDLHADRLFVEFGGDAIQRHMTDVAEKFAILKGPMA